MMAASGGNAPANAVRVLVVAADDLTRAGLAALVAEAPGFAVAGQTRDSDRLLEDISLYGPDMVVWDASESPDRLTVLADLETPVVAIVAGEDAAALAWGGGARGILPRTVGRASLAAAMRAVAEGLTTVDARLAGAIVPSSGPGPLPPVDNLTPRELQILQLVAEGLPNKSIAATLHISEHTVKFHVNSILGKMGAQSRTEAVTLATRLGLIRL
jgi:DNA-binding NarL/FixJ family response regulator